MCPPTSKDFGNDPVRTAKNVIKLGKVRDGSAKNLGKLTVAELRQTAKVRKVKVLSSIKTAQLLSHLLQRECHIPSWCLSSESLNCFTRTRIDIEVESDNIWSVNPNKRCFFNVFRKLLKVWIMGLFVGLFFVWDVG